LSYTESDRQENFLFGQANQAEAGHAACDNLETKSESVVYEDGMRSR